jgi:hypothetical protein
MMTNDPTISCLAEQVDCYRRLAKLAELQHVHVEQNQTEALLDVLGSRQQVLDRIAQLEQTIGPARKRWGAFVTSIGPDDRLRAEALLAETRALLEQITTSDRHDVLVLQQRKLNLGQQIKQAMAARTVNRNYGAATAYGKQQTSNMDVQR